MAYEHSGKMSGRDNNDNVRLPFGRTSTTPEELKSAINRDAAIEELEKNGVDEPDLLVREFIEVVPGLLEWLEDHGRVFPWRQTTDPWRVYISEILLQRTRAAAVEEVYDSFFRQFPNPASIRDTPEDTIRTTISSLGFGNQRTRTLQEVAEILGQDHDDTVPKSLEELQRPWRVGPYSARATLLFAFGEPVALVDTNFARIIERIFEYEMPSQPHKSDRVYRLLESLVPDDPGLCRAFNFAMLDLGNEICKSEAPLCSRCPLVNGCKLGRKRNSV